jgi:iron complex transport system substrate-binding protein
VLAVTSLQQSHFFDQLRSRGVTVQEFEVYALGEVLESFRTVGRLLERELEADALVKQIEAELHAARQQVRGLARPRIAVVLERDPLYVAGGGTFLNTLIEAAGGENVFGDLPAAYPRVSLESLADRAPALILDTFFDPTRAEAAGEDVASYWRRFKWLERAEPFPYESTLPAPNLGDTTRLLQERFHPRSAE